MKHLNGAKLRGKHTTLIDLAREVVNLVTGLPGVTGISAGYMQNGKAVSGGTRKVKIAEDRGGLLLTVRQARSVQELRVYTPDAEAVKLAIARALRDAGIPISFRQ